MLRMTATTGMTIIDAREDFRRARWERVVGAPRRRAAA